MERTLLPALGASCTEGYPAAVSTGAALSAEPRRSIR
jgi:hypothetical protein